MTAISTHPVKSDFALDAEGHREYTAIWDLVTDLAIADGESALEDLFRAEAIAYGHPYRFGARQNNFAYLQTARAIKREAKKHNLFRCTLGYSTRPRLRQLDTPRENPLDEPPVIYGSFVEYLKPLEFTADGDPVLNSADEPFVPAIEIEDARDSLVVEFNTALIDLSQRADFRASVNSEPIWGLDPLCVRLRQWTYRVATWLEKTFFVQNRLEFEINTETNPNGKKGWIVTQLDAGYRELIDATATDKTERYRTIVDSEDRPRNRPTPLDGSGRIADVANGDLPYYHDINGRKQRDFRAIPGLPNPLPGPFA